VPEQLICPQCGAANPPGSESCANCGWAPASTTPEPAPKHPGGRGGFVSGLSARFSSPFTLIAGVLGVVLVLALALVVVLHFVRGSNDSGTASAAPPPSLSPAPTATGSPTPKPSISTPKPVSSAPAPDDKKLGQQVSTGILKVVASGCRNVGSRVGSAFMIGKDTAVASYGSLAGARVIALTDGTKTIPAHVSNADAQHGVVVLKLDRPIDGHVFSVDAVSPKQGDSTKAFGVKITGTQPEPAQAKITDVGVETLIGTTNVTGLANTEARVDGGMSGAPTVADNGHATGMVLVGPTGGTMMIVPGQSVAAAIKNGGSLPAANCSDVAGPDATVIEGGGNSKVRSALQDYFGGINSGDYSAAYRRLSNAGRGGTSYQDHVDGWATSYDFNIVVHKATGSSAHVSFDSIFTQGRGPKGSATCARWDIDYQFVNSSSGLLINKAAPHSGRIWTRC
jgi:hypothetical protein